MRGKRQRHSYTSDTLDLPNPRHRQQRWLRTAAADKWYLPRSLAHPNPFRWARQGRKRRTFRFLLAPLPIRVEPQRI